MGVLWAGVGLGWVGDLGCGKLGLEPFVRIFENSIHSLTFDRFSPRPQTRPPTLTLTDLGSGGDFGRWVGAFGRWAVGGVSGWVGAILGFEVRKTGFEPFVRFRENAIHSLTLDRFAENWILNHLSVVGIRSHRPVASNRDPISSLIS